MLQAGALEGQEYKKAAVEGKSSFGDEDLVSLSVQNLLDCDYVDYGCDGGLMDNAFNFIANEGGIDDWKSYPYEEQARECRFEPKKVAMDDFGAIVLPEGDEDKLKRVVATFGPVSVAIDASLPSFQMYKKGVYAPKTCKNQLTQLDHGVLVVGYGTDEKQGDYWIVKNSWSDTWGEQGYIRIARNKKNKCGVATFAVIPKV